MKGALLYEGGISEVGKRIFGDFSQATKCLVARILNDKATRLLTVQTMESAHSSDRGLYYSCPRGKALLRARILNKRGVTSRVWMISSSHT